MSLDVQFSKLLALRAPNSTNNFKEECLPEIIEAGKEYPFDKSGQRVFDILRVIPLHETEGNELLKKPLALITIIEPTHYIKDEKVRTKGKYKIERIINNNEILIWNFGKFEIKKGNPK